MDLITKYQLHFRTEWVHMAGRVHGCVLSRGFPKGCIGAHDAVATIFASFLSGPSCRYYICQWTRRLALLKVSLIYGPRSALRRRSCSSCERDCTPIYTNSSINIHFADKTAQLSQIYVRNWRDGRYGWFWRVREEQKQSFTVAKRPKTWRGGERWWELAVGLVVASGDEKDKAKED